MNQLTDQQRRHFTQRIRDARSAILADAEAFLPMIHVFESLGHHLAPHTKAYGLGADQEPLTVLAAAAPSCPTKDEARRLFELVRSARNDAVHAGARARHLARSVTRFSLLLDEAMSHTLPFVDDFLVSPVVMGEPWTTLREARSVMLEGQFTFLPVLLHDQWKLISASSIARYLASVPSSTREQELRRTLQDLAPTLAPATAVCLKRGMSVASAVEQMRGEEPALVLTETKGIEGIITAYDLM
jgi:hypothetical protein